jgi:hypothetical protein
MRQTGAIVSGAVDQQLRGLPNGISIPTALYLDQTDVAFTDRNKVGSLRMRYEAMRTAQLPELQEMRILFDMFIGKQWTSTQAEYLETLGRVSRTINIMLPQGLTIEGVYINSQTRLKLVPRGEEDVQRAAVRTAILNHSLDQAEYQDHKRRQFTDAMIGRRGWMEHAWEFTGRYADGQYVNRNPNPFDILFDTDSSERDVNRGRHLIHHRMMSGDRIIQLFVPSDNKEMIEYLDRRMTLMEGAKARERRMRSTINRYAETSGYYGFTKDKKDGMGDIAANDIGAPSNEYFDNSRGLYRCIQFHERRMADRHFVLDPMTRNEIPVADADVKNGTINQLVAYLGNNPLGAPAEVRIKVLPEYWAMVVAPGLTEEVVLLEQPYSVQNPVDEIGYAIQAFTCFDQHPDKGKHVSYMDLLKDVQIMLNKQHSTREDIQNRFVNPDVMGYNLSFGKYFNDWLSRKMGRVLRLSDEAMAKDLPLPQFVYPNPSVVQMLDADNNFLLGMAERITGVNANIQGRKQDSQESGTLFSQRTQQSENTLAVIFRNLKTSMVRDGRYVDAIVSTHMTEEREFRIIDPSTGRQSFLRVNEFDWQTGQRFLDMTEDFMKYDCEMDTEAFTESEMKTKFLEAMAMLGQVQDASLRTLLMPNIVTMSGLPKAQEMAQDMKKYIAATMGPQFLLPYEQFMQTLPAGMLILANAEKNSLGMPVPPDPEVLAMLGQIGPPQIGAEQQPGQPGQQQGAKPGSSDAPQKAESRS